MSCELGGKVTVQWLLPTAAMASVSPQGATCMQTALPSLAVTPGGWLSEADLTADKCLCARLPCQSVLAWSNTSHVFAFRAVFVDMLCCCRMLRVRMNKQTHTPLRWWKDWTFTGFHNRRMVTCSWIGSSRLFSRAVLLIQLMWRTTEGIVFQTFSDAKMILNDTQPMMTKCTPQNACCLALFPLKLSCFIVCGWILHRLLVKRQTTWLFRTATAAAWKQRSVFSADCHQEKLPTQDFKQDSTFLFCLFCALLTSSEHPPSSLFVLSHLFMWNKIPFFVGSIPAEKKKPKRNGYLGAVTPADTLGRSCSFWASLHLKKRDPKRFCIRHVLCSLVTWQHKLSSCPGTGKELVSSCQVLEMLHAFMTRKHHFLAFFPTPTRNHAMPLRRRHELSCKLSDLQTIGPHRWFAGSVQNSPVHFSPPEIGLMWTE